VVNESVLLHNVHGQIISVWLVAIEKDCLQESVSILVFYDRKRRHR